MRGNDVLRLDSVTAGYKGVDVLRDLTLNVPRASVVALLGPNGAGKTTALRFASGMLGGRAGRLYVGDDDLTRRPAHRVAQAGVCHIPEGRGIYPSLTVRENIAMFSPRIATAKLVDSAVAAFPHLKSKLKQAAGTLSGGEQQMLAIARALMARPRLLLMDEPSMGLAPALVDQVFDIIQTINGQGTTILVVEQNAAVALGIARRGYVLQNGRIVIHDTAETLLRADHIRRAYLGEN